MGFFDRWKAQTPTLPDVQTYRDIPALMEAGRSFDFEETRTEILHSTGDEGRALVQIERVLGGYETKLDEMTMPTADDAIDETTALMVADYRELLLRKRLTAGPPLEKHETPGLTI